MSELNRDELSVGDVVKIVAGMAIPVDGIVLKASGVQVDESAMTGESDHLPRDAYENCVKKQKIHESGNGDTNDPHAVPSCVVLSGTAVTTGEGLFLCTVVGEKSCEGKIQAALEDNKEEKTPLQIMLNIIATDIGKLGMFCAILIFHALVLRSFIEGMVRKDFDLFGGEFDEDVGKECRFRYPLGAGFTYDGQGYSWLDQLPASYPDVDSLSLGEPCNPPIFGDDILVDGSANACGFSSYQ
jgi:hypothetical protein